MPTYGPVPAFKRQLQFNGLPEGDPAQQHNPYPYSISNAKKLLSSHGWKVVPGGVDTCQKPGTGANECGAGITKGEKLSFQFLYASGVIQYTVEIQAFASAASEAGIQVVQRAELRQPGRRHSLPVQEPGNPAPGRWPTGT